MLKITQVLYNYLKALIYILQWLVVEGTSNVKCAKKLKIEKNRFASLDSSIC